MHYITEIGLTSRFFQVYHAYHTVYHKNSGTLPLTTGAVRRGLGPPSALQGQTALRAPSTTRLQRCFKPGLEAISPYSFMEP